MEISEVRVKLVEKSSERLRAFCSVTLDGDFVIRDLKIIDGTNGAFVAMPSRKLADRCSRCGCKNHLRAKYCNDCGQRLNENRAPKDAQGRSKLHADVAHPINAACRERIQKAVIVAFQEELERSKSPDYKPPKFDDFDDEMEDYFTDESSRHAAHTKSPAVAPSKVAEPMGQAEAEDGDYNALIADLKRDAAGRRERDSQRRAGSVAPERVSGNLAARRPESGGGLRPRSDARPGNRAGGQEAPRPAAGGQPVDQPPRGSGADDDFNSGI